jgi:hypothetical protein
VVRKQNTKGCFFCFATRPSAISSFNNINGIATAPMKHKLATKRTMIAAEYATWYRRKKLDYSSEEMLTITSQDDRKQIRWAKNSDPMIWKD